MLIVLIKAAIVFLLVLFCVRLMGKRQLGEMQPFELVIMLIVAEVACIPLADPYIPFYGGIVPIITLTFMHIVISLLSRKSMFIRRIISGKSMIVIDKNGINYDNLKKMNLNMHDLLETAKASGYPDINGIEYAIIETNGKLCVIEKETDPTKPVPALLPLILMVDGKWDLNSLQAAGLKQVAVINAFKKNGVKNLKEVLYADIRQDGLLYVSPKRKPYFTTQLNPKGDW